jgi:hypothetical protein
LPKANGQEPMAKKSLSEIHEKKFKRPPSNLPLSCSMKSQSRQYLFGALFVAFGIYQAIVKDYLEFSLYTIAGLAFVFNALTFEPKLWSYKKPLVIFTWILIISTGILFLYLLQFKYL